jgi:hypothetical protein
LSALSLAQVPPVADFPVAYGVQSLPPDPAGSCFVFGLLLYLRSDLSRSHECFFFLLGLSFPALGSIAQFLVPSGSALVKDSCLWRVLGMAGGRTSQGTRSTYMRSERRANQQSLRGGNAHEMMACMQEDRHNEDLRTQDRSLDAYPSR